MNTETGQFHDFHNTTSPEGGPKYTHDVLHDPTLEVRLDGVETFAAYPKRLEDMPNEELVVLQQEFAELPEVKEYVREPVKIGYWQERLAALPPEALAKKVTPEATLEMMIGSLESMLQSSIARYAESVRQFKTAELKRFTLEPDEFRAYMSRIDSGRRIAHEALLSSVNAFSRALNQKIPGALPPEARTGWEEDVQAHWFDHARQKSRTAVGEWAIRTEIFQKSEIIQQLISEMLEKKSEASP